MYRTHTCGELTAKHSEKKATLAGWVHTRRDHGGLIFIDLRDQYGITQVRFDPKTNKSAWEQANTLRSEFVIQVAGTVVKRPKAMVNTKLATGEIELEGRSLTILNEAKTPPFPIDQDSNVGEDIRLKYRYLDLRRPSIRKKLQFRSDMVAFIRHYLIEKGFQEVETPILGKSTPEGARDYLVPSRQHPGQFYALPQSPQQYKQLLMVGGFDKYFQIAPCFRDEDARADRAPDQFYQLDLEMAFAEQKDILDLMEGLFTDFATKFTNKKILCTPWPRLTYAQAMETYGSDKPDLRFGMELVDVTELAKQSSFSVFTSAPAVKGITCPGGATLSRKDFEDLTEFAKKQGAEGLVWAKVKDGALESPIAKFLDPVLQKKILQTLKAKDGDAAFFVAGEPLIIHETLGALRKKLGDRFQLAGKDVLAFCSILDFPLFEERMERGHFAPKHHMFTRPKEEDLPLLDSDTGKVRSWQHDMVLNGAEVAGGSLRIYRADVQEKIFKLIGFDADHIAQFQHMLDAFRYGAPPHGGIAFGIDRAVMMFLDEPNIREITAFPKTGDNRDLTLGAPSTVDPEQLRDAHIRIIKD